MTDLRKLSEAATPGKLHYDRPCNEIWAGAHNEHTIAEWVSWGDGEYICALWNEHRSGSLIPRSEYERVLALLADARPFVQMAKIFEERGADTTLSRIDDALAAEPEARG